VSTAAYEELTTRLAMSIDGARRLEEINDGAWDQLAADISYRPATLRAARSALLRRAAEQASRLTAEAEHNNAVARAIAQRIADLQATAHQKAQLAQSLSLSGEKIPRYSFATTRVWGVNSPSRRATSGTPAPFVVARAERFDGGK
jgi:hypothetical protein